MTVEGRLRDVGPAVRRGLPIENLTVLNQRGGAGEGEMEFELVGVRGEPGVLQVDFDATDGSRSAWHAERPITMTVRVGRFGDAKRERRLVERIARELITLSRTERGVQVSEPE